MSPDAENIIELLGPREVVGRAISVLMSREDLSRDAAFGLLVQGSCDSHRTVRDFAADIVDQSPGGG